MRQEWELHFSPFFPIFVMAIKIMVVTLIGRKEKKTMKFYDRERELAALERSRAQAEQTGRFTVVVGRRRVGKTSLLLKAVEGRKFLYLFVSRTNEALLCERFQEDARRALGLEIYGRITRFRDLFEQLLLAATREHYTLIVDEFQEFEFVNPAVFSEIQDLWDRYKDRVRMHLVVCGSIYSMMNRIFENRKEPLFGRQDSKLVLRPFSTEVQKAILRDYNPAFTSEDLLCLYMLTGGIPKYIAQLVEAGAVTREGMIGQVTQPDSPFLGEGRELLVSEFGREHGTYLAILQLIAAGKNTQAEIDSIIGKNTGAYLSNLESEYSLVSRIRPMFASPQSRKTRWAIHDNYLRWWFHFIYPRQALVEMGRMDLLRESIEAGYEQYSGLVLGKYFREKMMAQGRFTEVGNFWDNKGGNEIDLIALNDLDKTALVAEVKRNPKKINLQTLARKAEALRRELAKYRVELRGFSLEDM